MERTTKTIRKTILDLVFFISGDIIQEYAPSALLRISIEMAAFLVLFSIEKAATSIEIRSTSIEFIRIHLYLSLYIYRATSDRSPPVHFILLLCITIEQRKEEE